MSNPIQDAAKQLDDWADRQKAEGFTGSARMMGQAIGQTGNAVTPVYERPIGGTQETSVPTPELERALLEWLKSKLEYETATRVLEAKARKLRGY